MKPPKKIYLHGYEFDDSPCKTWEAEPKVKGMRGYKVEHAEYIHKKELMELLNKEKEVQSLTIEGIAVCHELNKLIERINLL